MMKKSAFLFRLAPSSRPHPARAIALGASLAFAGCGAEESSPASSATASTSTTDTGQGGAGGATGSGGAAQTGGTGGATASGGDGGSPSSGGAGGATASGGAGGATASGGDGGATASGGAGGATASGGAGGAAQTGGAGGSTASATCGDGFAQPGEDCDDANADDADGCKADCTFTCTSASGATDCDDLSPCTLDTCEAPSHTCSHAPDDGASCTDDNGVLSTCQAGTCLVADPCAAIDCVDNEPCNGLETCTAGVCSPGVALADGASCAGGICLSEICGASLCGDGFVDAASGEECEPPGTALCTAGCKLVGCGNAAIEAGEQCDDGGILPLDGCDGACRYETIVRMTTITIQGGLSPAWCTPGDNRFGAAFSAPALDVVNYDLNDAIDTGSLNTLIAWLGLDDLGGVDDAGLELGLVAATLDPQAAPWSADAIDGWFVADPSTVDLAGKPLSLISPATLASRLLEAGPSDATMPLLLGATAAPLVMRDARMRATVLAAPAPNVPAPPPAALAAGLAVFQQVIATGADEGMCGNVTVESLAKIPLPEVFAVGGLLECNATCGSATYAYCGAGNPVAPGCNSLLDAIVGGCVVNPPDCVPVFYATQPDVGTNGNPPELLVPGTDGKVMPATGTDAYSGYFQFEANRAHLTNNLP